MCARNLECEELQNVFQQHLQEGRGLHFGELLSAACRALVRRGGAGRGRPADLRALTAQADPVTPLRSRRCAASRTCWVAW